MILYHMFELTFKGPEPEGSLALVNLCGVFECDGEITKTQGFYAGNGTYKVRFYPKRTGTYHWRVNGVVSAEGEEICTAADGDVLSGSGQGKKDGHGMVRARGTAFQYDDGTWYYPFGTTIYALVHQTPELIGQTMRTLKTAPFNKVRFCIFPKHYDFNNNEPEFFAFEKTDGKWDVHRPCLEFWDRLEQTIFRLEAMGIESDLILFHPYDCWGFSSLSKEECMVYLDYTLRRLGGIPGVWWSLANEYDLMENFEREWWDDFANFIGTHDVFGHLLSNHNWIEHWNFDHPYTTHCCIQGGNLGDVPKLKARFHKPVIFDECGYEGNLMFNWGNLSARQLVHRIWTAVAGGGYCTHGETFNNPEEVLWWSKGGVLHGKSPKRIEFLRSIIEGLPGPLTEPVAENTIWDLSPEKMEEMKKDPEVMESLGNVGRCIIRLPMEKFQELAAGFTQPQSRCGEDAYLYYYGQQCVGEAVINLPEDYMYRVEVIDSWEMTRAEAAYNVNGSVRVTMPGKEGMAILATKIG